MLSGGRLWLTQQKLRKQQTDDKFDDSKVEEPTQLLDDVEDEDDIFAKDEVAKNLDATQLYLGEIGFPLY